MQLWLGGEPFSELYFCGMPVLVSKFGHVAERDRVGDRMFFARNGHLLVVWIFCLNFVRAALVSANATCKIGCVSVTDLPGRRIVRRHRCCLKAVRQEQSRGRTEWLQ